MPLLLWDFQKSQMAPFPLSVCSPTPSTSTFTSEVGGAALKQEADAGAEHRLGCKLWGRKGLTVSDPDHFQCPACVSTSNGCPTQLRCCSWTSGPPLSSASAALAPMAGCFIKLSLSSGWGTPGRVVENWPVTSDPWRFNVHSLLSFRSKCVFIPHEQSPDFPQPPVSSVASSISQGNSSFWCQTQGLRHPICDLNCHSPGRISI